MAAALQSLPRPCGPGLALLLCACLRTGLARDGGPGPLPAAATGGPRLPNWQGCGTADARALPYCDRRLPLERRLDDLMSRLSLEDRIAQITPQKGPVDLCTTLTAGKPEIGLPSYLWLEEANSQANSACPSEGHCSTTFVGPAGMGASFNRSSWRLKGSVIGTEMRALSNTGGSRFTVGGPNFIGLTAFGPNINLVRDPRFGRNSELPGEDPVLSGAYAQEMVGGMQERDAAGFPKVAAFLKHFTAYSVEANRGHDDYNISAYDFFDSYLAQYERAFLAQPFGVMCSYNAENGRPSCANGWLLNDVLRSWRRDAVVTSDCGVVADLRGRPVQARDDAEAAAYALMNGTDLEMGTDVFAAGLPAAIARGLASEARVAEAARRTLRVHFEVGRFDPPEASEWAKFGLGDLNSSLHQRVSYEAALQSLVLLKNDRALPLRAGARIAVLGPQAVAREGLLSDYATPDVCFGGGYSCVGTVAEGLRAANAGGETLEHGAVDVNGTDASRIPQALEDAAGADAIVLVLGIDKSIEHEGVDRQDTALPGLQEPFALRALALGKPTVLVLTSGGALAIDNLINRRDGAPYAIVQAFNPAVVGGRAIGATLFGLENRWGKLPVTMYPHSFIGEKAMTDFSMTSGVGRTYRYYTGQPLFPFGMGLSLTTFDMQCQGMERPYQYRCAVTNTGSRDGDEVVQVYHRIGDVGPLSHPVPMRSLVDFARVRVQAGSQVTVDFQLSAMDFEVVNAQGRRVLYPGRHGLIFSRGHGPEPSISEHIGGVLGRQRSDSEVYA